MLEFIMEDNGNVVETVGFRIQTNRETEMFYEDVVKDGNRVFPQLKSLCIENKNEFVVEKFFQSKTEHFPSVKTGEIEMVYTPKSIPINQIANQVEYEKNCYMRKGDIYYEYSAK